jgi:hypothetical protein
LAVLAGRGRPLLQMSRIDLGIAAFIYLNLGTGVFAKVAHTSAGFAEVSSFLDSAAECILLLLLLLMAGGLSLVREGRPLRVRDSALAAAVCIVGTGVYQLVSGGAFDFLSISVSALGVITSLIFLTPFFVLLVNLLNSWVVAILYPIGPDTRQRLVFAAAALATALTAIETLESIGGDIESARLRSGGVKGYVELVNGTLGQEFSHLVPLLMWFLLAWTAQLAVLIGIALWTRRKTKSRVDQLCGHCQRFTGTNRSLTPLRATCPHCGSLLRVDLLLELKQEEATC